jgi:uncharacterized surface protein with fasciclin (FAS1) repeats
MKKHALLLASLTAPIFLSACTVEEDNAANEETTANEVVDGSLADALAGRDNLSTVAGALEDAGLASLFENEEGASYTLFAPTDTAFAELGEGVLPADAEERRTVLATLLRDHIVPGYLTIEDIEKAVSAEDGRPVTMTTVGDSKLTFVKTGDTLTVTGEDGEGAAINGAALDSQAQMAIPIDGLLKSPPDEEG